jgi:hypothetical protein
VCVIAVVLMLPKAATKWAKGGCPSANHQLFDSFMILG